MIPYWTQYERGRFVKIISPIVPFMDWDTGDSAWHPDKCISFSTKEEVITFVEKEAKKRHLLFSLWKTKGGIHGICLNWKLPHVKAYRIQKPFLVDPVYQIFTTTRGYVLRVSPKEGRPEGKPIYLGQFGKGRPIELNQRVDEAHTRLIYTHF